MPKVVYIAIKSIEFFSPRNIRSGNFQFWMSIEGTDAIEEFPILNRSFGIFL